MTRARVCVCVCVCVCLYTYKIIYNYIFINKKIMSFFDHYTNKTVIHCDALKTNIDDYISLSKVDIALN